ncbi:MAG TPA: DUF2442 domain-containing protein [Anaerolineales bacterium]|nr:DUF2442 domain-containing protein [Anaerolineales bacterium]
MIIHVTNVKVVGPYSLVLTFDNGTQKRVNLRQELYGPIFEPLRDPSFFAKAYVDPDSRTVAWPNGADFAPDFLYKLESEEAPAESVTA